MESVPPPQSSLAEPGLTKVSTQIKSSQSQPSSSTTTELWATMEEYLRQRDDNVFSKFNDDLNTLLVFAGLYSAILTAFVIEFYGTLQTDNGQSAVQLLSLIYQQLATRFPGSGPEPVTNTLDSVSLPIPITSGEFTPSLASIWINVLFFVSLLFSVAAALLAMITKRWIREYLAWSSLSAHSGEVVVLRQLRSDAWHDWNVSFIVSCVPALLELALVLFLGGMVTLLWTLNSIVTVILTIFTAIFLCVTFVFTVLPIAYTSCPYKTPLGWACVWTWEKIAAAIRPHRRPRGQVEEMYQRAHSEALSRTWKDRDLHSVTGVPRLNLEQTIAEEQMPRFIASVLLPLIRALVCVGKETESEEVLHNVDDCVSVLEQTASELVTSSRFGYDKYTQMYHRLDASLLVVCGLFRIEEKTLLKWVSTCYTTASITGTIGHHQWIRRGDPSALEKLLEPHFHATADSTSMRTGDQKVLQIIGALLVHALQTSLVCMFPEEIHIVPNVRYEQLCAYLNILCLAETVVWSYRPGRKDGRIENGYIRHLKTAYKRIYENRGLDSCYPGLRTFIAESLCRFGHAEAVVRNRVKRMGGSFSESISRTSSRIEHGSLYARVAVTYAREVVRPAAAYDSMTTATSIPNWMPEDRHLFVTLANHTFEHIDNLAWRPDSLQEFLNTVVDFVKNASTDRILNLGCYMHLPWISTLHSKRNTPGVHWSSFSPLLDALVHCLEFITADAAASQLDELRQLHLWNIPTALPLELGMSEETIAPAFPLGPGPSILIEPTYGETNGTQMSATGSDLNGSWSQAMRPPTAPYMTVGPQRESAALSSPALSVQQLPSATSEYKESLSNVMGRSLPCWPYNLTVDYHCPDIGDTVQTMTSGLSMPYPTGGLAGSGPPPASLFPATSSTPTSGQDAQLVQGTLSYELETTVYGGRSLISPCYLRDFSNDSASSVNHPIPILQTTSFSVSARTSMHDVETSRKGWRDSATTFMSLPARPAAAHARVTRAMIQRTREPMPPQTYQPSSLREVESYADDGDEDCVSPVSPLSPGSCV